MALFASIINLLFYIVLIYNNLDKSIEISNKFYLGSVIDIEIDRYYYLNNYEEAQKLIIKLLK